jgi:hypothetical protein
MPSTAAAELGEELSNPGGLLLEQLGWLDAPEECVQGIADFWLATVKSSEGVTGEERISVAKSMNREMKAYNDSIASGVPTDWSFGGDRFSSPRDHQIHGVFRAWGDLAIAGRIHSYSIGVITCPGAGNRNHSAVARGKVNAQGYPPATSEQHGRTGRKHENDDRICPPESQQDLHSSTPCPSQTKATCLSAVQTPAVNNHSHCRKVSNSDKRVFAPRVANQELDLWMHVSEDHAPF